MNSSPPQPRPRLRNFEEMCAEVGLGEDMARELVEARRIPFIRLGDRTRRFEPEVVVAALRTHFGVGYDFSREEGRKP